MVVKLTVEELDLLDRKIMYELDLNSRASVLQIAKKVRKNRKTVGFRINRLIKEEYIKGFYTVFDTAKLGYFYYKAFIKFNRATPEKETEIINFIKNEKHCAYLGSCDGPFDIIFLVMVKQAREFKEFIINLSDKFGEYILEKNIHTVLTTHRLNAKFLYAGATNTHSFYQDEISNFKLDETDKNILDILSKDSRINLIDIGKKLDIDSKVIKYRMKNLEKDGVIKGYVSSYNFDKLGLQFIQLNFTLKSLAQCKPIIDFFDQTNKCLFALELLGKYDLTIELHIKNINELREIMDNFKKIFVDKYIDYDIYTIYKEHVVVWAPF